MVKKSNTLNNFVIGEGFKPTVINLNDNDRYVRFEDIGSNEYIPSKEFVEKLYEQQKIIQNQLYEIKNNTWLNTPDIREKADILEANLDHLQLKLNKLQEQSRTKIDEAYMKISNKEKEFQETIDKYNLTHETYKQKVEELLPSALSAGLASSYKLAKDSFTIKIWVYIALIVVLCSAIGWFAWNNFEFYKTASPTLMDISARFLLQLPFVGLFIWLIAFITTKLNGEVRLQQEYAHKEAIASSYSSFKHQIESIGGDQQQELLQKLMNELINNVSFNPSKTLDKNSDVKTPTTEIADTLQNILAKLPSK